MKCYVHQDTDAVGVCSSCGRGVCRVCALKLRGKIYCKEDAARLFDVQNGAVRGTTKGGPKRGPEVIIGAIFGYILGGIAALVSFVLIYAGIIGAGGGTALFAPLTPNLSFLGDFQGDPGGQLLTLGFLLLAFGSFGVAASYYFFRPTKAGGVAALVFGLIGLVGAFELESISITPNLVDPWFAFSGIIIALSLTGLARMIRAPK